MGMTARTALVFFILASSIVVAGPATAQSYPTRPIRLVVPTAPGGSLDVLSRIVGQRLAESVGQPVIVDNRPAGGGTVGSDLVAK